MDRKLEIGPGNKQKPGPEWVFADAISRPTVDVICRWGWEPLPFETDTFVEVFACHVLEHIPWHKTVEALSEVCRVLKPGGMFEVHVPNVAKLIDHYLKNERGDRWHKFGAGKNPFLWFAGRMLGYGEEHNWHKAVFDMDHLIHCLCLAGFDRIEPLDGKQQRGTRHYPNLAARAYK